MAEANRAPRMLRLLGAGALVAGAIAALVLWWFAGQRYDDAVADLAPAPIGCDTTLVFDRVGTYTLYLETRGQVGEIDGDCDADDRSYDLGDDDPPAVEVTLLDDRGGEVDLDGTDGPSYDRADAQGQGFRTVEIDETGEYVLTADAADSDDAEMMIRVGRDPSAGVTATRVGAVAVLLVGLTVGVGLLVAAQRRTSPAGPPSAGPSQAWPQLALRPPPTAPPYANPSIPPPYGVPQPRPAPTPPARARPPGGFPGRGGALPPPPPPPPR